MKFKKGDKVSFINERQNGVVVNTFHDGKVIVEIEDGFEIEVFENELVKIGSEKLVEKENKSDENALDENVVEPTLLDLCRKGNVIFAGVPAATGAVLTGVVNYYLINNSDYDLVFTFTGKRKSGYFGITKGVLQKENIILLEGYRRSDLTDIESFLLEALIFYSNQRPSITHIRKETAPILPGITQTNSGTSGVAAFAKIIDVYSTNETEPENLKDLFSKFHTKEENKNIETKKKQPLSDHNKYGIHVNEKIVDLHIEEIQSDFSHLTNAEMIAIQMRQFSKEMDNAIRNHYKRIVFIHGVGNGVLKREIRNELRNYKGIVVREGEFSKYGNGATEVNW